MSERGASRRILLIIAAFLVVGAASVLATPRVHPFHDMADYDALGFNLAAGRGYSLNGQEPSAWRVPGYPLLLAGVYRTVGHSTLAVRLIQVLIACLAVWATYRLALLAFRNQRAALWAAALAALCPTTLLLAHEIMTETLFTALFLLGLLAAFAWREKPVVLYAAAGAIMGAAALVRPIGAAALLALPILLWADKERCPRLLGRTAAAWLGFAVIMSPWWYRNWRVFDTFIPTDLTSGPTFFIGNNELAAGSSDFSLVYKLLPKQEDRVALDRIARRRALAFILNHPGRFVGALPGKAAAFWGLDRDALYCYREGFWGKARRLGLLALSPSLLGIAVLLPLALLAAVFSSARQPVRWMLWPIIAFWVVAALTAPRSRIHAPLVPALAVLAGACIADRLWRPVARSQRPSLGVLASWAVLAALAAYWCWEIVEAAGAAVR